MTILCIMFKAMLDISTIEKYYINKSFKQKNDMPKKFA